MNLETLGWNSHFEEAFAQYQTEEQTVGRVALEHKKMYRLHTEDGDLLAEVTGNLRFQANDREDFPAVGDWVTIKTRPEEQKATIYGILPRQSKFSRKATGTNNG